MNHCHTSAQSRSRTCRRHCPVHGRQCPRHMGASHPPYGHYLYYQPPAPMCPCLCMLCPFKPPDPESPHKPQQGAPEIKRHVGIPFPEASSKVMRYDKTAQEHGIFHALQKRYEKYKHNSGLETPSVTQMDQIFSEALREKLQPIDPAKADRSNGSTKVRKRLSTCPLPQYHHPEQLVLGEGPLDDTFQVTSSDGNFNRGPGQDNTQVPSIGTESVFGGIIKTPAENICSDLDQQIEDYSFDDMRNATMYINDYNGGFANALEEVRTRKVMFS